jgi:cellulose synthase/poly-beta-1,6-N-acetylglucosamine synthase-like glycosyltransferase
MLRIPFVPDLAGEIALFAEEKTSNERKAMKRQTMRQRDHQTDTASEQSGPLLSVIVPVYRQWNLLAMFLRCWEAQTPPVSAELICVNNDPLDPPPDLPLPLGARIVDYEQPGSYAARNAGAALASGAWLVFTDADCRPDPGWLAALSIAMAKHPGALLAGDVRMVPDGAATPWARFDLVRGIPQARYVARGYAATANLAVPARLFRNLGGFDAYRLSGGDAEFCRRAGAAGAAIRFIPEAVVVHPVRATWSELKTKARRVKGAQVTHGAPGQRGYWLMRTCLPPIHEMIFYLKSSHRQSDRLTACAVRLLLWLVELREAAALLIGGKRPERR